MRLRGATEQATRSPDGDARAREQRATRVPARPRRRSLPWLLLGVLLVAGCALAFAVASVRLSGRQPVLVVTAASSGAGAASSAGTQPTLDATVVGIQAAPADSSVATVVSLQVSEADAASVAAAGSGGDVSLVLVSPQGGGS